jgi:dephospho-CoA kinase
MSGRKPIIGLAGGIGAGKSFVAAEFAKLGCLVICADENVRNAYWRPEVKAALRSWWGESVFLENGDVDRKAVASKIFASDDERRRLEALIHPIVAQHREQVTRAYADHPEVAAFIWDVPLLFETGLNEKCDAVVFVDAPAEERLARVQRQRKWDAVELARREKAQWPLDKKREISDYVISNTADAGYVRDQVQNVLSLILGKKQ